MSSAVDHQQVWLILSRVPAGKVITYGQLADMVDAPRSARVIGNILKQLPASTELPWHIVINHKGQISFPKTSKQYQKQKRRLKEESIMIASGKIDLKKYRWHEE